MKNNVQFEPMHKDPAVINSRSEANDSDDDEPGRHNNGIKIENTKANEIKLVSLPKAMTQLSMKY